jgi:AraC-like DNA-binding protein/mannose-6-phosphate isomerase-like protein (cupin superfamily)
MPFQAEKPEDGVMKKVKQEFTARQYMISSDFEFFHYRDEAPVKVEYHNHIFYEAFFFLSGDVTYIIEGKSYRIKPGDIILINNRELHKTVVEPGKVYERYVLWIDPDFIRTLGEDTDLTLCFERSAESKYNILRPRTEFGIMIKNILACLESSVFSEDYGSRMLQKSYLTEMLVYLNRAFLDSRGEDIEPDVVYSEKVSNVIRYINDNLNEELSLETLASRFYTSKYHLLREFKKHTGYTIHQYIHKKRLIMARMLLKEGLKVTEVCLKCGFGDYSNFIRSFKNEFGHSPKHYKDTTGKPAEG